MLSSKKVYNKRVYADKKKSLGCVRALLMYDKKCVCYQVKRPDFLWMFHRKPIYLNFNECIIKKDGVFLKEDSKILKNTKKLAKKNDIEDNLISWLEMPVSIGKEKIGYIDQINFNEKNGEVLNIELSQGMIAGAILGKATIEAEDIEGYSSKQNAILLKDGAKIKEYKKGVAEKAGSATSYVVHKVKKHTPKVIDAVQDQSDKIHDMFKEFKEEVKKGMEE